MLWYLEFSLLHLISLTMETKYIFLLLAPCLKAFAAPFDPTITAQVALEVIYMTPDESFVGYGSSPGVGCVFPCSPNMSGARSAGLTRYCC